MRSLVLTAALFAVAAPAATPVAAQTVRVGPRAQGFAWSSRDDRDRAMLGISTSTSGRRDTLGLLISSVTSGGPAEKAGLEEGNRITAINGVNLKLSREDADDDDMRGVPFNRLQREMRKVKPGDEVTLDVWGGGRSRTVKVKTVSADDLDRSYAGNVRSYRNDDDRAALGVMLSSTGNKRDTIGVFVSRVVEGGPADKAGISEGDRIASINGVDLKVSREDAGDASVAMSRIDRLEREIGKLKPGQSADLTVVSGGRSRTVKVTAARAADLPRENGFSYFSGPGTMMRMYGPNGTITAPRIRINRGADEDFDPGVIDDAVRESMKSLQFLGPMIRKDVDRTVPRILDDVLPRAMDKVRIELDGMPRKMEMFDDEMPMRMEKLRDKLDYKLDEKLPRKMEELRAKLDKAAQKVSYRITSI